MSARKVLTRYAVGMGVLVGCFFAVPALRTLLFALVGLAGATAVLVGVRWHRPQRGYTWWLLSAGMALLAVGDTLYSLDASLPSDAPASAADVSYLLMFPLIGAGLLGLTRSNIVARDRSQFLDFLIFCTAGGFLLWIFVLGPYLDGPGLNPFSRSTLAAFAFADLLVLAATARLLTATPINPAAVLLLVGAAGMLAADLGYGIALHNGGWQPGGPVELGWFTFSVCWGAAALHPRMTRLTVPAQPRQTEVGRLRLVLLGFAAVLAPAVLLLEAVTGEVHDGTVIAVVSGVMFVLVLSRLADAADAHRLVVSRERSLRKAAADLVSATAAREVDRAVRAAVARLVPKHAPHRVVFTVNRADGVPATATSIWGPAVAEPSTYYPAPSAATARRTRLLRVGMLQPALAGQLGQFSTAVLCPLVLDERATGVPRVGALLVAADQTVLAGLRDSLEVLAAQVALALERIGLSQEISRRDTEAYFRSVVQNATDVILVVDDDRSIRYASPSVRTVIGIEPADCAELNSVVHPDDRELIDDLLDPARSSGGEWADWTVRRPDGERIHLEVSCRDLRRDRTVRGVVVTMRDMTERRRLERELTHRSLHDVLTGLANRASFQDQVYAAVGHARRSGRTVGVLCIDLDEFSSVNDAHGHAVGDGLLIAVGQRLRELVGATGMVARLGGDEFAVLVPDAENAEQAERIADDLVHALAEPLAVGDTLVNGSVSIGVATSADATDAGELLKHGDLALYVAKGGGKGRWCRYQSELHTAIVQRLELRTALAEAVERRSFMVEYQPIVDLYSGAASGFEALVRWHHPGRGLVPPDQFIALAEETGLIEQIGDWVLREAVAAAGRWRQNRDPSATPYVSVNVSARQLRAGGFVDRVRAALGVADVPPTLLMLEITESLLLRDDDQVWAELTELRTLGVRVAIDDFGTGFSSLSYLQQMPADVLKIDRSFTATVASSRRQLLLLEGIIRLAGTLSLDIIAEGVETEVVRTLLMDMGCASGQGYLFSRPLAEEDATRWGPERRSPAPIQRA
ncbi:putative bifunctional diguanylate cyclase/phosphodiesterase [Micromonospora sp. NPDC050417]|uniref:putative bifunctional diguanylate cyclase/phosphodiesterase n=1 Tax=Micromonospora sp. NPDC050417 TaxID=3364280 RepID=UPI00379AE461